LLSPNAAVFGNRERRDDLRGNRERPLVNARLRSSQESFEKILRVPHVALTRRFFAVGTM